MSERLSHCVFDPGPKPLQPRQGLRVNGAGAFLSQGPMQSNQKIEQWIKQKSSSFQIPSRPNLPALQQDGQPERNQWWEICNPQKVLPGNQTSFWHTCHWECPRVSKCYSFCWTRAPLVFGIGGIGSETLRSSSISSTEIHPCLRQEEGEACRGCVFG